MVRDNFCTKPYLPIWLALRVQKQCSFKPGGKYLIVINYFAITIRLWCAKGDKSGYNFYCVSNIMWHEILTLMETAISLGLIDVI